MKKQTPQELREALEMIWRGKLINPNHINRFPRCCAMMICGIYVAPGRKPRNPSKRKAKRNG